MDVQKTKPTQEGSHARERWSNYTRLNLSNNCKKFLKSKPRRNIISKKGPNITRVPPQPSKHYIVPLSSKNPKNGTHHGKP